MFDTCQFDIWARSLIICGIINILYIKLIYSEVSWSRNNCSKKKCSIFKKNNFHCF